MSLRVKIDDASCQGYGNCVLIAEEIFSIGDDGRAKLLEEIVADTRLVAVQTAAYDCPTGAISYEQLDGDAGS
jgi:ferredoxin